MTTHPLRPIAMAASLILFGGATAVHAQAFSGSSALRLLAPDAQDQIATTLHVPAPGTLDTSTLERAPIAVSWALDPAQSLDARPRTHVQESRDYWLDASEAELQRGVTLALSAPGAVIRISPHAGNPGARVELRDIVMHSGGQQLHTEAVIQALADEDALRAAGMDLPAGSLALRLSDTFAARQIELALPTARGAWLVHVHEPASKIVLHLGAERDSISGGEALRVHAGFPAADATAHVSGLISAPDGHSQPLEFERQADGRFVASVVPDAAHAGDRGLWEVHAFAQTGGNAGVPRDARSAFAVSLPVARLDGRVERVAGAARVMQLGLRVGVETLVASRYQISAVLYGTAADGQLHPAAFAQSAAWLGAGQGLIDLGYDAASLAAADVGPPWELRDLRLVNQADMSLLERRERALAMPR